MRISWTLVLLPFWTSLAAASNAMNISSLASCALSCITTNTNCSLDGTLCACYGSGVMPKIQSCFLDKCNLANGMQSQELLESSCKLPIESQKRLVVTITLSFSGVAILFVLLRTTIHTYEKRKILAEDCSLVFAAFGQAALAALYSLAADSGFGEHTLDIASSNLRQVLIYMFSATPIYWLVLLLTRLAVVLFLRRLTTAKSYRFCIAAMMIFIVVWGISIVMLSIFQCWPISYNWNMHMDKNSNGYCWNLEILSFSSNAISTFQSFLVLLLAAPLLWNPNLTRAKKFGTSLVLLGWLFVCLASGLRLGSLVSFSRNTLDTTWNNVPEILWSGIETATGIILVCLPVLGNFCQRMPCGCLQFPDEFFGANSTEYTHSELCRNRYRDTPWVGRSPNSSGDNFMEHTFEARPDRLTSTETESMGSKSSLQNRTSTLIQDRSESLASNITESREHFNQVLSEHDIRSISPLKAPKVATKQQTKRIASPTQAIFHDVVWRDSLGLSDPLQRTSSSSISSIARFAPTRVTCDQQLQPYGVHLSRTSQGSHYSVNSELSSRNSEARSSQGWESPAMRNRDSDSTRQSCTRSLSLTERSQSLPDPPELRPSTQPSQHSRLLLTPPDIRPSTQPSQRLRTQPLRPLQLNISRSSGNLRAQQETILEHQDENFWADKENGHWPIPAQWTAKQSRIRRTNSGRAIVFDGQILQVI